MYESDRTFQMWDYNVSHRQLLLRSPRSPSAEDNIDIRFWSVECISLPMIIETIKLRSTSIAELGQQPKFRIRDSSVRAFVFENSSSSGFVVAVGCKVLVNQLDIFDSSLVYADRDRPPEEYGKVLIRL